MSISKLKTCTSRDNLKNEKAVSTMEQEMHNGVCYIVSYSYLMSELFCNFKKLSFRFNLGQSSALEWNISNHLELSSISHQPCP